LKNSRRSKLAAVGFQRDRAPVNVVGFEPSSAAHTAAR
jgi:hypothetical protein